LSRLIQPPRNRNQGLIDDSPGRKSFPIAPCFVASYISLMNQQSIGDYNILKKAGAGGMSSVYLAVHRDVPNLKVILKVLSDRRMVERFHQEADKLALLDGHPHICQIKHFFNHGDEIVIAMEYIDGSTLEETMEAQKRLPVATALQIIIDVLGTLDFAHQKRIFHRDIKPSNIMIDRRSQVKIIDFGIAKAESDPSLTVTGSSCGTPLYMAPEQFNPTETINYALVDVYAVGTTLYYLVTGQLPFSGDNQFALRDAKLFTEPPRPRDLNPEIPKAVEQIILKAIDKDPENRYASVMEMQEALKTVCRGSESGERTETINIGKPSATRPKKKMGLLIGAAVILVAAVTGYFVIQPKPEIPLPATPRLLEPAPDAVVETSAPTFFWQGAVPEGGAHTLEYAGDQDFRAPKIMAGLTESRRTADSLPPGDYFWRVKTVDKSGRSGAYSAVSRFTVAAAPPPTPPIEQPSAVATAKLELSVYPEGDIYVDGRLQGSNRSNAVLTLDAGRHSLRVENRSSTEKAFVDTVTLASGATERRQFRFTMPPLPPPENRGEVRVGSLPLHGASVYIDGRLQALKTPNTFSLSVGQHVVKAVLMIDGVSREMVDTVFVESGGRHKVFFDFEK